MAELEIRGSGALFLDGLEIGQVTFSKPFVENEVVGFWYSEDDFGEALGVQWGAPPKQMQAGANGP